MHHHPTQNAAAAPRSPQQVLADEVTALVHGPAAAAAARRAGEALFGGAPVGAGTVGAVRGVIPEVRIGATALSGAEPVVDALTAAGLCRSRAEARRLIAQGGASVNGERAESPADRVGLISTRFALIGRGRKRRSLLVVDR